MSEWWVAAAASLLVLAAVVRTLALWKAGGRWHMVATAARLGAALATAVALWVAVTAEGEWSPFIAGQVALGLTLAMLAVYLILGWRLGTDAASPAIDLIALAAVVAAGVAISTVGPRSPILSGIQGTAALRTLALQIRWGLLILGAGGLVVAGAAATTLGLRAVFIKGGIRFYKNSFPFARAPSPGRPDKQDRHSHSGGAWADLHGILYHATAMALVFLGAGLTVGAWWSWRNLGTLVVGDPSGNWAGISWLMAAMSLLSRRAGEHWGRWTAVLALTAAGVALLGLLAGLQLRIP